MERRFFVVGSSTEVKIEQPRDISALLEAWNGGEQEAMKELIALFYPEIRRIARQYLARRAAGASVESALLANEAYLKLIRARGIQCRSRAHFLALCAQIIRRILVDHARNRRNARHGGDAVRVPLEEALLGPRETDLEVLALDEALDSLSKLDGRKGRVVELRYFGGLSVEETAEVLNVSPETVLRDWKLARTWLYRELGGTGGA